MRGNAPGPFSDAGSRSRRFADVLFFDSLCGSVASAVNGEFGGLGSYPSLPDGKLAFVNAVVEFVRNPSKTGRPRPYPVFANIWNPMLKGSQFQSWYGTGKLRMDHYYFEQGCQVGDKARYLYELGTQRANGVVPGRYPPFSGREEFDFAPFGKVLLKYHPHEEVFLLPHFIGKGVKHCDFKFPVDVGAGNLVKLGLASDKPIDVKGVKVSPLDVLAQLVPAPANAFFTEDEAVKHPVDFVRICVLKVKGVKSGEDIEYIISCHYNLFATTEERLEIYKKFGTLNIYVALPVIAGAKMCVGGFADKGVIAPECLDPIKFMKTMADMGWPLKFKETTSKSVSIS